MLRVNMISRILVMITVLVIATTLLVSSWVFTRFEQELVSRKSHELDSVASLQGMRLNAMLQNIDSDVLFLAGLPEIDGIVRAHGNEGYDPIAEAELSAWQGRLESVFVQLMEAKEAYIQVRLIGLHQGGREIVRVDRSMESGEITAIPSALLQEKASRPYFQNTIALPEGETYLSEIELNREHGEISYPLSPVIRSSTPIYNADGSVFGIVVINQNMTRTFRLLVSAIDETQRYLITNEHGDYLYHPEPGNTFQYEFGRSRTIQQDYPQLASVINNPSQQSDVVQQDERSAPNSAVDMLSFRKVFYNHSDQDSFIGVAIVEDLGTTLAVSSLVKQQAFSLLALIALVILMLAYWGANRIVRPIVLITDRVQQFTHGQGLRGMPETTSGEASVLSKAFVDMATKVQQREVELREQIAERARAQQFLVNILDSAADGIFTFSPDLHIRAANLAFLVAFDMTENQVIGEDMRTLVAPNDLSGGLLNVKQIADNLGTRGEYTGVRADGTQFPLEMIVSEILSEDEHYYTAIIRDVTELRIAQNALKLRNRELEIANADLESFAYAASHDLKEPLRTIISFTDLTRRRYKSELGEEGNEYLNFAVDAANRLQALIVGLLDFSKAGVLDLETTEVDCNKIVERVSFSLSHQFQATNSALAKSELPVVSADGELLERVFQNLMANAVKFVDPSRQNTIHIRCEVRKRDWLFAVSDSGIGIEPEYTEQIFGVFKRLHGATSFKGSGVGLALCRKIVERHGGRIWAESKFGEGSTFYFTILKHASKPTSLA